MIEKKSIFCMMVIGFCFLTLGSLTPLWAAPSDTSRLIDLLKRKNIINQQEADSLLKEIQKDREASAGKGEFLPPALRGFKFGTTIFGEWQHQKPDNGSSLNKFVLNRAYLTLTKDINDWMGMNATADIFNSRDPDDNGNGLEVRLKFAFADFKFFGTSTRMGLIPTPSDAYDSSIWPYRVQGPNLWDVLDVQSTADLGVSNQGVLGGYMDDNYLKFASKPFAGYWGGYYVGIYNGPGFRNSEANDNKVVTGLFYVRPLPDDPMFRGLQLAYAGTYGRSNSTFDPALGNPADYPEWDANIVQISLQNPLYTIMSQYYWGKATATSVEEHHREAFLLEGFARVPSLEKLRVFAKYYYHDPNTDGPNDDFKIYIAGLSYDVAEELMPFLAFERRKNELATPARDDYDKFQIGFQLKF